MSNPNRQFSVLFVDDEPRITVALKAIFRREYEVLTANSAAQALQVLSERKVNVIVSDQRMPQMLGNELLAEVAAKHPQTMRILLTGFMDREAIVDSINEGEVYRFISKPWRNEEMQEVVADAALASEIPLQIEQPVNARDVSLQTSVNQGLAGTEQALLMIERQQEVRNQIRRFCSDKEIMIYGTQNVEQAVVAATSRDTIGVAVVELSNNPQAALQTINLLKQARPELITIVLTDEFDTRTAVELINKGQVYKYLAKPLDMSGFQRTIETAFSRHRYLKSNTKLRQRYRVEKHRGSIVEGLQGYFNRLVGSPA